MKNKNVIYGLVLLAISLVCANYVDGATNTILAFTDSRFEGVDRFISKITGGAWQYATLDAVFAITIAVPVIFMAFAIFFGIRAIREDKERGSKSRLLAVGMVTFCVFVSVTIIFSSILL